MEDLIRHEGGRDMSIRRRTHASIPRPLYGTIAEFQQAMRVLDENEARARAARKETHPALLCGWCDQPADVSLGEVAGEVFCRDHFETAQREAVLNGGVLVTVGRRQKEAFGKARSRVVESERSWQADRPWVGR
jgi:hypothetical protein